MAEFNVVILFNGTSDAAADPTITNVVKMRDGLVQNEKQMVIYCDGIGNDVQWRWYDRWFSVLTGLGGTWVMREAYSKLLAKLHKAIENNHIKEGDTINISFGGFSRGAALARHFVNQYILVKLKTETFLKAMKLNFTLRAGYLFDTVAEFEVPPHLRLFSFIGILQLFQYFGFFKPNNRNIWNFNIPDEVEKVHHAMSIDEKRKPFTPTLIDEGPNREQIWYDGDHSCVGGGHPPPTKDTIMCDQNPLRFMIKRAVQNGLLFKQEFLDRYFSVNPVLGKVVTPSGEPFPPQERGPRKIYVQVDNKPSNLKPVINSTVIQRMIQDPSYRPVSLQACKAFQVRDDIDDTIKIYGPRQVTALWKSLTQKKDSPPVSTPSLEQAELRDRRKSTRNLKSTV